MVGTRAEGFPLFTTVYDNGIASTGVTAVVNDRDTSLTVPWDAGRTGSQNIVWTIDSDDGSTYTVTVPVVLSHDSTTGKTTAEYTKGTYSIAEVT
jgi:hypothetical protein